MRLPVGVSEWLRAYPADRHTFEAIGLRNFMHAQGGSTEALRELWFAYLVRILKTQLSGDEKAGLEPLFAPQGAEISSIYKAFRALATKPVVALDRLDERLEKENRFVFVTYDELEKLGTATGS